MQVHVKAFGELSPAELYAILRLRVSVFMLEQNCLYPDLDGLDPQALHVWLSEDGELAAYLRVLPRGVRTEDVMIGRVIAVKRGCGLDAQVMREGIRAARERFRAGRIWKRRSMPRAFTRSWAFAASRSPSTRTASPM